IWPAQAGLFFARLFRPSFSPASCTFHRSPFRAFEELQCAEASPIYFRRTECVASGIVPTARANRMCQRAHQPLAPTTPAIRAIHSKEELIVKFPVQKLFASRTLAACVAVAASFISVAALAQSAQTD